jgi:hypothetical protein
MIQIDSAKGINLYMKIEHSHTYPATGVVSSEGFAGYLGLGRTEYRSLPRFLTVL